MRVRIYIQRIRAQRISALGHELISGCVLADAFNLMLIFASYYYAPWPWSCIIILRMIRRILKAPLHFKLAV